MSFNHSITRRSMFKEAGGIAAASFLGADAVLGGAARLPRTTLRLILSVSLGLRIIWKPSSAKRVIRAM